jgi:hypothetical protein
VLKKKFGPQFFNFFERFTLKNVFI